MTAFDDLFATPPSGGATPLIIDHVFYGEKAMLHGPFPYTDAVAAASYYGQAQGMLAPDGTYVDMERVYARALENAPEKVTEMGARTRTGYALRTMLGDDDLAVPGVRLLTATEHASRTSFILRIPAPVVWLARAATLAGQDNLDAITPDHTESAAMYVSDWLRRFEKFTVAALMVDARTAEGLDGLPATTDESLQPVRNAAEHYGWKVMVQGDDDIRVLGTELVGKTIPGEFWTSDVPAPSGDFHFTAIPADADPDVVLERRAALRES